MAEKPVIKGADVESAMDAMGITTEAYKDMLGSFRRGIPGKIVDIREKVQLPDKKVETINNIVHINLNKAYVELQS